MAERARARPVPDRAGLAERRLAQAAVERVLKSRAALDDSLDQLAAAAGLEPRDEALARAIATATVRRFGTVRDALKERLERGLPREPHVMALLATGAAQVLFLDVPDHAAVDMTVALARADRQLAHYAGLTNAVLRRVAREREAILAASDPFDTDTPPWLAARWASHYGEETARAIAAAHRTPAALDLSVKADAGLWAERLGAVLLPTGSLRLLDRRPVAELPGFAEGSWWVQDAAAALPARLLRARPGERVADLCAAPGGKTAQLAAAGARVLAVDRSAKRLERRSANMTRLGLAVETLAADATMLEAELFDAILVDAPCSSTGTLRRHPDVAWTKSEADLTPLTDLQRRLLDRAVALLREGGRLVFCSCSLEPEEGERQVEALLARAPALRREPIRPEEVGGLAHLISAAGDIRTLPCHRLTGEIAGLDGFFAARFVKA